MRTGSDRAGMVLLPFRKVRFCWSGWRWQGAEPLPAGQECLLPWPVRADLEDALASVVHEAGREVPDPVASLNLEMIMVLGEADGGLRRA